MLWNPERNFDANVKTGMWIPVVWTIASVPHPAYARFGGVDELFRDGNSQHTDYELEFRTDDLPGLKVGDTGVINGDTYSVKTMPAYSDESQYFSSCNLQRTTRSYPKRAIAFPSGAGLPGYPAPPGTPTGSAFLNRIALGALGSHCFVRGVNGAEVNAADNTVEVHAASLLGITLTAALSGAAVRVQTEGEMEYGGWSWVPEQAIWLGVNGQIVQAPPDHQSSAVFGARVAFALTPTKIFIHIQDIVYL